MDKKGQIEVGAILITAITLIVGVILFTAISQQVGSTTTLVTPNVTLNTVVNGTAQYLTDYKSLTSVVVQNETGGSIVAAGNYTVTNNFIHPTTGALSVKILPDASTNVLTAWYVSGTAQPLDYIDDSAGRAIAGLIAVFFALAIAVVAMTPALRSGLMNLIGKN